MLNTSDILRGENYLDLINLKVHFCQVSNKMQHTNAITRKYKLHDVITKCNYKCDYKM